MLLVSFIDTYCYLLIMQKRHCHRQTVSTVELEHKTRVFHVELDLAPLYCLLHGGQGTEHRQD